MVSQSSTGLPYLTTSKSIPVVRPAEPLSLSMGIHATHLRRQQQTYCICRAVPKSFSQRALLVREDGQSLRPSRSADRLDDVNTRLEHFKRDPEAFTNYQPEDSSSSDDEYFPNGGNANTLSSASCCSITTDANCDFEFFQTAGRGLGARARGSPRASARGCRITRSNSKRSLENFQAYLEENGTLGKRKGKSVEALNCAVETERLAGSACYGGSAPDFRKIFISEYI